MTEEKKDILLRQGNPLTESRYKFTPTEKNAFLVVVKNVRKITSNASLLVRSSKV